MMYRITLGSKTENAVLSSLTKKIYMLGNEQLTGEDVPHHTRDGKAVLSPFTKY